MKFRILSDLHLEFGDFEIPSLEDDKDTILILAGDTAPAKSKKFRKFHKVCTEQFHSVYSVFGNHEYYGSHINYPKYLRPSVSGATILNNSSDTIGNIAIVGTTLWTDFFNANPLAMMQVESSLNDYRHISGVNNMPLMADDILGIHRSSVASLERLISYHKGAGREVVVVTHHPPSFRSIDPIFANSPLNAAFASHLDDLIIELSPTLWIHGHTHCSVDYFIDSTRIICNPRGYVGFELNPDFNPTLVIEV